MRKLRQELEMSGGEKAGTESSFTQGDFSISSFVSRYMNLKFNLNVFPMRIMAKVLTGLLSEAGPQKPI